MSSFDHTFRRDGGLLEDDPVGRSVAVVDREWSILIQSDPMGEIRCVCKSSAID